MEGYKTNPKAQNNDLGTLSHKTGISLSRKKEEKKKGETKKKIILARLTTSVINGEE